jgi:Cof subfamily protein (haloacid dehalogenase superfamily)
VYGKLKSQAYLQTERRLWLWRALKQHEKITGKNTGGKMGTIFEEKKQKISDCLLALDLDGTLTNSKKQITPVVRWALKLFMAMGGRVVLASGRPTYGIMPLAEELELKQKGGYILAYNGGCLTDCKTGRILYQQVLDSDAVQTLACQAKEYQVNIMTYQDQYIITQHPQDQYCLEEKRINHMEIKKTDNFAKDVTFPVTKCLMTAESSYLETVEKRMQSYWKERLTICRSAPYFLEITARGIDKAQALNRLLNHLGMRQENLIACGDGFNDQSMIAFAGIGVAMANGQKEVKQAAEYIAPSNDEDGIADVVGRLIENSRS